MKDVLQEFAQLLERAAVLGEAVSRKQEAVAEPETAVLESIITAVKPVLAHIAAPVEIAASHSGHRAHTWRHEYLDRRGLILVDEFTKEYTDRDYRGDYKGTRLVLTGDGDLLEIERFGRWSKGEPCHWDSDTRTLTPRQAVENYDFADIVSGLVAAFRTAAKGAEQDRDYLTARLKLLEEIQSLIAGGQERA